MSDSRFIDEPPAGAEGWRQVWTEDRRYRPSGGWFRGLLRKIVGRATQQETDRQRNFNVVLIDLLNDIRNDIAALRNDLKNDVDAVQRDARAADAALSQDIARTAQEVMTALARDIAEVRALLPVASARNDALIAALDQKLETLAVRVRDVTNPILAAAPPILRTDFVYRRLEDGMRGSEAEVRESVAPYVALAQSHQPVIDVGCGRGELLIACREAGINARGFDTNERSVADLRAHGIDATLAAIPECFAGIANDSVGTVVAMHVVEHLPVDALFALFAESARVLRRDGLLIIETPNAEAYGVTGSEFWRDPTHIAPRHPAALTLLAQEHGFAIDELRAVHPFPDAMRFPGDSELTRALNERFFAGQDLRMVLRK